MDRRQPIKATGRRYDSVDDLIEGEGVPKVVQDRINELRKQDESMEKRIAAYLKANGIEQLPGEMTFLVKSDHHGGVPVYRVELEPYKLNGRCDCIAFRCSAKMRQKSLAQSRPFRCKHIRYVRDAFLNVLLMRIMGEREGAAAFSSVNERSRTFGEV